MVIGNGRKKCYDDRVEKVLGWTYYSFSDKYFTLGCIDRCFAVVYNKLVDIMKKCAECGKDTEGFLVIMGDRIITDKTCKKCYFGNGNNVEGWIS